MCNFEWLSLCIALAALLVSLFSLIHTIKATKQNLQMAFFAEYTRRYQDIELGLLNSQGTNQEGRYYHLYFDLCSEEYYLYSHSYLPSKAWEMWVDGMKLFVKNKGLQNEWIKCSQFYDDNGFGKFFGDLIKKEIYKN